MADRDATDAELPAQLEVFATELALGAGALVREWSVRRFAVTSKSTQTDLVTEADRAVEQWLVTRIAAARPGDAILAEEGGGLDGTTGVRWLLDPIDGTVNFVLGLPRYAVSVAAEIGSTVLAGAVCDAATGEVFHARLGSGAYLGDQRIGGPRRIPLDQAVLGTGFGYDAALRARQLTLFSAVLPRVADMRRLGSASLDLCAVAAGRLDGYFETGLNRWDYAAGALIAAEAGCRVTGVAGAPPDGRLTAAAGESLAEDLFELLDGALS